MRIHVTGGPGAGKTYAAKRLGAALGAPAFHLDEMALDLEATMPPRDAFLCLASKLPEIYEPDNWISDGAYMGWALPLYERADTVLWMDTPAHVALYRIPVRHLKAELAGTNRFPGWRRLVRFWRWSLRYYLDRNPHVVGFYGVPETRSHLLELLRPFEHKLVVCRRAADVELFLSRLQDPATATPTN
jgi:adenylate kinase family enzyme